MNLNEQEDDNRTSLQFRGEKEKVDHSVGVLWNEERHDRSSARTPIGTGSRWTESNEEKRSSIGSDSITRSVIWLFPVYL